MKTSQCGFTFMELIIVFIILIILGAIAVPKFFELLADTRAANTKELASELSSANKTNYKSRKNNKTKGHSITNCKDVATTLEGGLPIGYTIVAAAVAVDASITCVLTGPGSSTSTFTATGVF